MATAENQPVTGASPFNDILTWLDRRFLLVSLWYTRIDTTKPEPVRVVWDDTQ